MRSADDRLKVLFVRFSAYGDIMMCLPALRHYQAQRPQDEVHVLTSPHFRGVAQHVPGIAKFHDYAPQRNLRGFNEYLKCAVELSAERFDAVFDWQANPRSRLLLAMIGARRVYTFARRARKHQYEKCQSTLREAGLDPPAEILPVPLCGAADRRWAKARLASLRKDVALIALGIGGRWETKLWPESYFQELMALLAPDRSVHFLLLGSDAERERGERLRAAHPEICTNLCGETTINQAAALVADCALAISHDTSIMHLAWAQGRPVLGIFGSTDPERTGPLGNKSVALSSPELDCHPCFSGRCRLPRMECLWRITPAAVARHAHRMLGHLTASTQMEER